MTKKHSPKQQMARLFSNWHNPFTEWQQEDTVCHMTNGETHMNLDLLRNSSTRQERLDYYRYLCQSNRQFLMTHNEQ